MLWILQGVLGLVFFASGTTKLVSSRAALTKQKAMGWATDFTEPQIKWIGAAEVLGACGLVAPWATGIVPILTPIAAACLVALMAGGAVVHVRRKEKPFPPIVLGALAAVIAVGRLGAWI